MSTFIAITISGLALGAVYFLVASGLSLIYGLMDVLNFAHGVFLTLGAYAGWAVAAHLPQRSGAIFLVTAAGATAAGAGGSGRHGTAAHPAAVRQPRRPDPGHHRT